MKIEILQFIENKTELRIQTKVSSYDSQPEIYTSKIIVEDMPQHMRDHIRERQIISHLSQVLKRHPIQLIESITIN